MKSVSPVRRVRFVRLYMFLLTAALLFAGTAFYGGTEVSANHPVLVEGNCDSPVPGVTIVTQATCGDFDGDGRIGTAEDTDGQDRIFGTLAAALLRIPVVNNVCGLGTVFLKNGVVSKIALALYK